MPEEERDAQHLAPIDQALKPHLQGDPIAQNTLAVLAALREPVSVDFITDLASNPDGVTEANQIEFGTDEVRKFIDLVKETEKITGITLLEEVPLEQQYDASQVEKISPSNELLEVGDRQLSQIQYGYRLTPEVQQYIEDRYPDLHRTFHGIIADRLWDDLGIDL